MRGASAILTAVLRILNHRLVLGRVVVMKPFVHQITQVMRVSGVAAFGMVLKLLFSHNQALSGLGVAVRVPSAAGRD